MSLRREGWGLVRVEGESVSERVRKVRESLKPDPKVKRPRFDHASRDYFAALVGAPAGAMGRTRVKDWEDRDKQPEPRYRIEFARLSDGVYEPDDFVKHPGAGAVHSPEIDGLPPRVSDMERQLAEMRERLDRLEQEPRPPAQVESEEGP